MFTKLKRIILTAAAVSMIATPALVPAMAGAATSVNQNICSGTNASASGTGSCDTQTANNQVTTLMTNIINFFSLLVGIVSVIMIIIGGFQYITSNGDSGKISTAKNTIIFALVGLIIVAMAQFIVHFVLGKVAPGF
ncbi:MAG TPA: pilin [Candidatus Saccharimonadales bacterium]|nr:pilin [Candidatus Saccharimonadales bacterium]